MLGAFIFATLRDRSQCRFAGIIRWLYRGGREKDPSVISM